MRGLKIGDRITICDAYVDRVNEHQGKDIYGTGTKTFFRHTIVDRDRNVFVFGGKWRGIKHGDIIDIKGTVKKFENKYKYIRLNRVVVIAKHDRKEETLV